MSFPNDFVWGAATSAVQIEGASSPAEKGPSIWDHYARWAPERFVNGDTPASGCEHVHHWRQDVELMKQIGLRAYRFSISWPRVLPEGTGRVNQAGLDFYSRLVDELLEAGIEPWVTLYHWDLPLALHYRGGWLNPDLPKYFEDYAAVVVRKLAGRVKHWMTLNEPQCFIGLGLQSGEHAPFMTLPFHDCLLAAHHSLLAHGRAMRVIRGEGGEGVKAGVALVGVHSVPASLNEEDIAAAQRATFSVRERNFWNATWFADAMVFGRYPEDGVVLFGEAMPEFDAGDMALIAQPMDFLGLNIYFAEPVEAGEEGGVRRGKIEEGAPLTAFQWRINPECLYWGPLFYHERYKLPVVITENGMAGTDWVALDGEVHDESREDFTARHLLALHQAIRDGADVRGYFHWSLMDNFEWAKGYSMRFGLVYVDFASKQRMLKNSAKWYNKIIRSNGALLPALNPNM